MLFYSVFVLIWAATCLATPPTGYVKTPDNDKDPPAYEYKYEIGDGTGKGQGKAETRSGEFASGSYYVNTGQAATDVKYFADDWGYHPVVKYGSTDKHSSTTTQFALGEHAVKALRAGGYVGRKVKLPGESEKRKPVQIIQPYSIGDNDPSEVTPTYSTIGSDGNRGASEFDEAVKDSREYSRSGENFPKESGGPSTILIPPSSHSTTPQEIAYTASTPTTSSPAAYAPLQEVRDIYANNDYQNAALIDEQLYLQSAAGNFGQKVKTSSLGESGIKNFRFSTSTASPESNSYSLTKQNGDVTYTVHSGPNANTAYLSSSGKSKKTQNHRYQYRQKFPPSSTTESPNYSRDGQSGVIFASTTSAPATSSREFTSNDLASEKQEKYEYVSLGAKPSQEFSEFGPADLRLVNYGLPSGNEGPNGHKEKLETTGLSAFGTGNSLKNENEIRISTLNEFSGISSTVSSISFAKPIVVAEVTPGYDQPEYSTSFKCDDDLVAPTTPAPIISTTAQPIISTETIAVTPKYQSQTHVTTSAVILNPIQAGVALVNAGETHLISQEAAKPSAQVKEEVSEHSSGTAEQSVIEISHERNRLNLEQRIHELQEQQREQEDRIRQEEQLERVKQLQEEIQLQQVQQYQQELELQRNQYQIQELQLQQQFELDQAQQQQKLQQDVEGQLQEHREYNYQQLGDDAQLQQEVELQQVEESQQNEQLQHQQQQQDQELIQEVHETQLDQKQLQVVNLEEQQDVNLERVQAEGELQAQQYVSQKLLEEVENQAAQQLLQQHQYQLQQLELEKYQREQQRNQASNNFVGSSESGHDSGIEIQKSIEIYHNEPVQEIHYQTQVPVQVESSKIDQSQGRQQYIELQSIENTQQAQHGQVSFEINHVPVEQQVHQLAQKDQFALAAQNQAQQVLVAEHQANLNQPYDLTRSNSLSQQAAINNGAVLLGFRVNHESGGRHNYQIDQHRENGIAAHGIDQQLTSHGVIFGPNTVSGSYQLNQRDQSHSHSHSHTHSHSYESNRGQQQVVVGLPYTLEASKELILPGVQTTSTQIIENPVFEKHHHVGGISGGEKHGVEASNELAIGRVVEKHIPVVQPYPVEKVIEKTVHVPQPYPVEKIVEKRVPYPVDRIVEKHVPILQPYPVHIKVPQPYPVETIVEKPIHIHVPVEKIVEKKVPVPQPYPVEVTKYVDKPVPVHIPQPYPVEKIVERIVEKPVHIRVPYAVEVVRNIPYGVHYGVSYQQIMRPHSHNLYINHGKARTPFYGLPVINRHQEFRNQENSHVDSKLQFQGYSYDKPAASFVDGGNLNDQITAGSQQAQFKHSFNIGKKLNSHVVFPHYSARRHTVRTSGKEKQIRSEEYIGPVPPQRSLALRHHQHSPQNQHAVQARSPQSSTTATRSPTSTTTLRRAREPETKPQSSAGNFRQSRVEYGFKPPMIPSVQYDEKTATKVES